MLGQAICDLLDQNREVLERVQRDLDRGLKNPSKGRHGLTARQVVGALVLFAFFTVRLRFSPRQRGPAGSNLTPMRGA
jgi:hypothetical protein